jgi:hypothetical protein
MEVMYMKKFRTLHLWIGLICSFFILIQAVTGLLLSEPWLIGIQSPEERPMQMPPQNSGASLSAPDDNGAVQSVPGDSGAGQSASSDTGGGMRQGPARGPFPEDGKTGSNLQAFIKGLHEGRIGGTDLKIVVNITAIGLILLTGTGIVLSVQTLRAQSIRRRKSRTLQEV